MTKPKIKWSKANKEAIKTSPLHVNKLNNAAVPIQWHEQTQFAQIY
jgi:hypothetical protein